MPELVFVSLEIRNFRGLSELTIERLGRVNLIVGKNNVGKTSVLEALRLYAFPGSLEILLELLASRDQFDPNSALPRSKFRLFFERFFYNETERTGLLKQSIKIGQKGLMKKSLSISTEDGGMGSRNEFGFYLVFTIGVRKVPVPLSWRDSADLMHFQNEANFYMDTPKETVPSSYVGQSGLTASQIERGWDSIALTHPEDDVIEAMRLIAPDVERLVLKPIDSEAKTRVPFVKLKGSNAPVSLRSLGDGMTRIFGIALALVNAKDGLLLIDEVENGLHYSVQPDIWRLIFQSASRLNVQVFATTHSLDCIKAFETAARESEEEGVLIRLAQKAGRTFVAEFDERELGVAVEGQIEVR